MVWAETFKIGCGYTSYRKRNFVKKFLVCNYGDAGNLLGSPVYQPGRPCSRCPANICSRKYQGLCPVPGEENPISAGNSTFIEMTNINNNIDTMRPSMPEGSSGGFQPMFVDTNDVEEFRPEVVTFRPEAVTSRPIPSRPFTTRPPTIQSFRPISTGNSGVFTFSSRPNSVSFPQQPQQTFFRPNSQRPISFFNRFFGNIFQGWFDFSRKKLKLLQNAISGTLFKQSDHGTAIIMPSLNFTPI